MAPRDDADSRTRTERSCLARLSEMDRTLREMEPALPEDARPIGAEARRGVSFWLQRLAQGGADLEALTASMADLANLMEALTRRLLLQPWSGEPKGPRS